jgi:hypothetical protein
MDSTGEPSMQELHQQLVASMVQLGGRLEALEARTGVMSADGFDDWFLAHGGAELLAERLGRRLGLLQIHLLRRAARTRPAWLDAAAVDVTDDLAGQLLDVAHDLRDA